MLQPPLVIPKQSGSIWRVSGGFLVTVTLGRTVAKPVAPITGGHVARLLLLRPLSSICLFPVSVMGWAAIVLLAAGWTSREQQQLRPISVSVTVLYTDNVFTLPIQWRRRCLRFPDEAHVFQRRRACRLSRWIGVRLRRGQPLCSRGVAACAADYLTIASSWEGTCSKPQEYTGTLRSGTISALMSSPGHPKASAGP